MMRAFAVTIAALATAGVAHLQVWIWLKSAFSLSPRASRAIRAALVVASVLPVVSRLATHVTQSSWLSGVYAIAMTETMIVLISALPIAFVRLASRVAARPGPPATPLAAAVPVDARSIPLGRRQVFEGIGGSLVLGSTSSVLGYGALRGRFDYVVEEVVIRLPGLPRALEGYAIAQVSDLHVGNFVQQGELERGLSRITGCRADMLVVTGDLIDFDPAYVPMMAAALAKFAPRDGAYAILGNHDYYAGADAVARGLKSAGVTLLRNEGRIVRPADGGGFALLGVDDLWASRYGADGPRLDRALSMVPDDRARVLLSHQPASVDAWAGRVGLQLSGHTHGGQVNPGFRPADFLMRYVAGRYQVGATQLYVNRGFGVVGPPVRVGAPPEITRIILTSA
jgi:hypothetical protein